jgi:hypothetical protein
MWLCLLVTGDEYMNIIRFRFFVYSEAIVIQVISNDLEISCGITMEVHPMTRLRPQICNQLLRRDEYILCRRNAPTEPSHSERVWIQCREPLLVSLTSSERMASWTENWLRLCPFCGGV